MRTDVVFVERISFLTEESLLLELSNPYLVVVLDELADLLMHANQWHQAESTYRRLEHVLCLQGTLTTLGHTEILLKIGTTMQMRKQYARAEQCYKRAVLLSGNSDENSYQLAICLNHLGKLYFAWKLYGQAYLCFKQAEVICTARFGESHEYVRSNRLAQDAVKLSWLGKPKVDEDCSLQPIAQKESIAKLSGSSIASHRAGDFSLALRAAV